MVTKFETEIVKTKTFNKAFTIVFLILYLISILYVFLYDKESQNIYLKYLALGIYLFGIYFIFGKSFTKPKKIGTLNLSTQKVEFEINQEQKSFLLKDIENIFLSYNDYGSWFTHSIYGNNNFIIVTDKAGNRHNLEILIKNKSSKEELKAILNSPEYYTKFEYLKMPNSRTAF